MSNHRALQMFGRSGNPALRADTFSKSAQSSSPAGGIQSTSSQTMTLQGTVNKTGILLALVVLSASWTWNLFFESGNAGSVMPLAIGGAIMGFIFALVTIFKKQWSGITAPLYALSQGLFLGAISGIFEMQYPGIVIQAVGLTLGTLASLLLLLCKGQ